MPIGHNKQIHDFFQEMLADLLSDKAFPPAKPLILLPCNSLFPRFRNLPETNNSTRKSVILPLKVHRHMDLKASQKAYTAGNKLCFHTLVSVNPLVLLYWKNKTNKIKGTNYTNSEQSFHFFCSSNAENRLSTPQSRSHDGLSNCICISDEHPEEWARETYYLFQYFITSYLLCKDNLTEGRYEHVHNNGKRKEGIKNT